jgi:sporulation protein YlmC with PRC-barrel domain
MKPQHDTALQRLGDTDVTLADPDQDIRERKVIDRHGADIGHISNLFIDEDQRKVRMLEIRVGGFLGLGDRHVLLPVDAITKVSKDEVHVSETRDRVVDSPVYDPALVVPPPRETWEPLYSYYGLSPYWLAGNTDPTFPSIERTPIV